MWARLRVPGAEALHVPCTGTSTNCPCRRPPRRRVCVSPYRGAKPPHPLCPKTRLPLRLRDPRPLGGTRGLARLQPGSAPRPGPRSERRAPRPRAGLIRIPGSLARRQPSGFAARAGDARCSRGRRPGQGPGRRAGGTPRTLPSSAPHASAPAALPAHTRSASPLPTSQSFQNPERPGWLPGSGGEGGLGGESSKKAAKLTCNFSAARTRADYMAQGRRPRRNKMA